MTVQEKLINIAKAEVGVTEMPPSSNNVKYNTWYYGKAVSGSAYQWCVVFLCWLFDKACVPELFYGGKKAASCSVLMSYAKQNGRFVTSDYKPGDLVFFNFSGKSKTVAEHIGIVVSKKDSDSLITIEGNTSSSTAGSQSNGGAVAERTRYLRNIIGAFRPNYPTQYTSSTPTTKPVSTLKVVNTKVAQVRKGDKGRAVLILQASLNAINHENLVVDGVFGGATETALIKYQKAHSECGAADGICGANTWNSILSE